MNESTDTSTNEVERGKLLKDLPDEVRELAICRLLGDKDLIVTED